MGRMRRRRYVDGTEINLVPMLDMISLLIQVLLIDMHFGALAQIEAKQGLPGPDEAPSVALQLDVGVDEEGFQAAWAEGGQRLSRALPCRSPCSTAADYDIIGLRRLLRSLKPEHLDENVAVISPHGPVAFWIVALTLDAVRVDADGTPLFAEPVIADGR